ncbi:MAG: putative membrane-bound dehydrogenase-like protein [Verrucomicrobiales bacterium]|jgi:putative membrane-bound dehydrogenase-like protein
MKVLPISLSLLAAGLIFLLAADKQPVIDAPLPPEEAADAMIVPEGFDVTLFAGEPDVKQPIGFSIDDRGRLWVAEGYSYPNHTSEPANDRIVIFEDKDNDGRFDKKTVFYDKLNYISGIEVGFGGAWVMSPPYFYFIPDADGDDVPDSEPELVLDGFGNHSNAHNMANGFSWGPDGWLYGTHGRTNWSMIGKPGASDDERQRFDGGVWRYHPITKVWEPFSDGTTNPWGIDWDDFGQGFVCNCVNPHLFHVIQGAHYEPWRNRESSRFAYKRIETIADHLHFIGGNNVRDHLGSEEELAIGGGHAHCGTMVYLGGSWPEEYRNTVFINNIHGKRVNRDVLARAGSGYTASHAPDIMISPDKWFMGVTIRYGPDGSAFVSDWSDTGECHSYKNTRRETGRIFKITYGQPAAPKLGLASMTDSELVELQLHQNDWYVQHARRLLQERFAAGKEMDAARQQLLAMFESQDDETRKLRALWALHAIGEASDEFLTSVMSNDSEYVRAWAVQLICEDRNPPEAALRRMRELAESGDSAFVRLHIASALQRLAAEDRWPIARALVSRGADFKDQNLPFMYWYAIEPLIHEDIKQFAELAGTARIPMVREFIGRRAASLGDLDAVIAVLSKTQEIDVQQDLLGGILTGIEGQRSAAMPAGWSVAYANLTKTDAHEDQVMRLALVFGDSNAITAVLARAKDSAVPTKTRHAAIAALAAKRDPKFIREFSDLVADPAVGGAAIRALALFDDPKTPARILTNYIKFDAAAKQDAVQALVSRAAWAQQLLDAVEAGTLPRTDISAFAARQIQSLGDDELSSRVAEVWGDLRAASKQSAQQISEWKKKLTVGALKSADKSNGRTIFMKSCAACHKMFGEGLDIGPELTGSQRQNFDYLLENIIDPSASVARDYRMEIIVMKDGRVLTGFLSAETESTVTLRMISEESVIPIAEIEERTVSKASIMPDGLLVPLTESEVVDLIAYLQSDRQVDPK